MRRREFITLLGGAAATPRRPWSARLAQEAEESCYCHLIKTPDRISEGPPRGGLSDFERDRKSLQ